MVTKFREELSKSEWQSVALQQGLLKDRCERQVVWGIDTDGKPRLAIVILKDGDVIGEFVDDCPLPYDPVLGFRMFRLLSELRSINDNSLSSAFLAVVHMLVRESKAAEAFPEHAKRTLSFFETFRDSGVIDAAEVEKIAKQLPLNIAELAMRLSSAGVFQVSGMANEIDKGRLQLTPELKRLGVASSATLAARKTRLEEQAEKYERLFEEYLASHRHIGCVCCAGTFKDNIVQGLSRGLEGAELVASSIVLYHKRHNFSEELAAIKKQLGETAKVEVIGGTDQDQEPFDLQQTIQSVAAWVGPKMSANVASLTEELRSTLSKWNMMPIVVE